MVWQPFLADRPGDQPMALGTIVAVVFALYLVRVWGICQFATLLGLLHGLNGPALLGLRLGSSVFLVVGLFNLVASRRCAACEPAGRIGRWLERWLAGVRQLVVRGSVFANFLAIGYVLNTYAVASLIPSLPRGHRRALTGAILGDLVGFVLDLAAILGLRALAGHSPWLLALGLLGAVLGLSALQRLVRRGLAVPAL